MYIPQEHYITIDSIKTRFYAEGEGSPVILIHGLGGSACGWLLNISAIAARHRVYALDLVGQGRTGMPDSISLDDATMARFVKNFMAEFNIERAHLVGHSMGAAIALQLAFDFPMNVNKLVLVDSGELGKEIDLPIRIYSLPLIGEMLATQLAKVDIRKFAKDLRASAQNTTYITVELIENTYRVEVNPELPKMVLKALRVRVNGMGQKKNVYLNRLQQMRSIQNPTLVIWGRQDSMVPLSHGELIVKTMPTAHLIVIEQSNHNPMIEQPEIFNELVLDFLKD